MGIFLDILLKPPQPLMGLFLMIYDKFLDGAKISRRDLMRVSENK